MVGFQIHGPFQKWITIGCQRKSNEPSFNIKARCWPKWAILWRAVSEASVLNPYFSHTTRHFQGMGPTSPFNNKKYHLEVPVLLFYIFIHHSAQWVRLLQTSFPSCILVLVRIWLVIRKLCLMRIVMWSYAICLRLMETDGALFWSKKWVHAPFSGHHQFS